MLPSRYQGIAHQLTKVPPEVVHEILDDLPIVKILELICASNSAYLEQCVSSHIALGKIFSPDYLVEVKAYFLLYVRIRQRTYDSPKPLIPRLNVDISTFLNKEVTFDIATMFKAAITWELRKYEHLFPLLQWYTPQPIASRTYWGNSPSDLQQIFENIDAGMFELGSLKSGQLKRMADIIRHYPGMTRVRDDTSQEPRKNEQHIISYLLGRANRMNRGQRIKEQAVALSVFARRRPFLVPYDRLLRLFLKTIDRIPPMEKSVVQSKSGRKRSHQYPQQLNAVLEGMVQIYPRDNERNDQVLDPLYRTEYTKYAAKGKNVAQGLDQPSFWVHEDFPPSGMYRFWRQYYQRRKKSSTG